MKICFDTKKSPTWTSGDLEFDDYNQSQPSGLEMPISIAIPAIVTNKNKFFFEKSKKNPHWGDFYKIMPIFS